MNVARNVPSVEMKFEDVENFMVEKAKKESLELVQADESIGPENIQGGRTNERTGYGILL